VAAVTPVHEAPVPAVERQVAWDMIRRALPVAPVLVLLASIPWGVDGGISAAYAIAIVLVNFAVSAALLAWAARISLPFLMGAALFGYIIRLALISAAVLLVKDQDWVSLVPLGFTLIVTHLGLLWWETRHVAASLAFPGLKPTNPHQKGS
jgi:hypothetical protein